MRIWRCGALCGLLLSASNPILAQPQVANNAVALTVQLAHTRPITCIAVSDDGELVATGSGDRSAKIWHRETGRELWHLPHGGVVTAVAFTRNNRQLITVSIDEMLRLWDVETGKLLDHKVMNAQLNSLDISPDGSRLVTGEKGGGVEVSALPGLSTKLKVSHPIGEGANSQHVFVDALAFSPEGDFFATGTAAAVSEGESTARYSVQMWDLASGDRLRTLPSEAGVHSLDFSSDGRLLLVAEASGNIRIVATDSLEERMRVSAPWGSGSRASFSDDDKLIAAHPRSEQGQLVFWDAANGNPVDRAKFAKISSQRSVTAFAFATVNDLEALVCGVAPLDGIDLEGGFYLRWHDSNRPQGQSWLGRQKRLNGLAISPDLRTLAVGVGEKRVIVWDLATGRPGRVVELSGEQPIDQLHLDAAGNLFVSRASGAATWVTSNGEQSHYGSEAQPVVISPDGLHLATATADGVAITDRVTGNEVTTISHSGTPTGFSSDGSVLTVRDGQAATFFEVSSGAKIGAVPISKAYQNGKIILGPRRQIAVLLQNAETTTAKPVTNAEAAADRKGVGDAELRIIKTGELLRHFSPSGPDVKPTIEQLVGVNPGITSAVFDLTQPRIILGCADHRTTAYSFNESDQPLELPSHHGTVRNLVFDDSGQWLLSAADDGLVAVWEFGDWLPKRRAMILPGPDEWAVVDLDGRYDAASAGDIDALHWSIGTEPVALAQLKDRYYDPGLLSKVFGFNKEGVRKVDSFNRPQLYPRVRLAGPTSEDPRLRIDLQGRDGGFGNVIVKINGKELTSDARTLPSNSSVRPRGNRLQLSVNLAGDPRLIPGKKNRIEVIAANRDGFLESRGFEVIFDAPEDGKASVPSLRAIVLGVSDYRGTAIDLRYAAKDAADFAKALRIAASRLFGPDRFHLTLMTTDQDDPATKPSKQNIERALESAAAEASASDILVVYVSGHGANHGGQDGDFYFLTGDAYSDEMDDPEVRAQVALSGRELTESIKKIPALKQVLILDTCASGRLIEKMTEQRRIPGSQIRALERVKDRTGMHVLAGCASDAVSYEATSYAQGLLTHSLLLGMRGGKLKEGTLVEVPSLFLFACDRVPQLAQGVGGIQRPMLASPKGGDPFEIGQVLDADKQEIPIESPRPLVLRASFQDDLELVDTLGLADLVNEHLMQASARGSSSSLVFIDALGLPSAFLPVGRYKIQDGQVVVNVALRRGDQRTRLTVTGNSDDLDSLAEQVVREILRTVDE